MLQNAYLLAKIGADTAENEQHFAEILPIGRRVADGSRRTGGGGSHARRPLPRSPFCFLRRRLLGYSMTFLCLVLYYIVIYCITKHLLLRRNSIPSNNFFQSRSQLVKANDGDAVHRLGDDLEPAGGARRRGRAAAPLLGPASSRRPSRRFFRGLVLGCIEAKFCK